MTIARTIGAIHHRNNSRRLFAAAFKHRGPNNGQSYATAAQSTIRRFIHDSTSLLSDTLPYGRVLKVRLKATSSWLMCGLLTLLNDKSMKAGNVEIESNQILARSITRRVSQSIVLSGHFLLLFFLGGGCSPNFENPLPLILARSITASRIQ